MSRQKILRLIGNYGGTNISRNYSTSGSAFLTLTRKRVQSKTIQIVGIRRKQYDQVVKFLNQHFLDDPLVTALKIPKDEETYRVMEAAWLPSIRENLSLQMTKKKLARDPKIFGVCVNTIHDPKSTYKNLVSLMKTTQSQPLQSLLNAWALISVQPKFITMPPNQSIFEISGIAVDKEFRRNGIANQLLENSVILAKLKGFQWIRVDCTSPYSAKICENNGFHLIYEKSYKELDGLDLAENEFFKNRVKVFIKPLKKRKPRTIMIPFKQI